MGAIARQGPHQVAQKSTRTGLSDFSTSWSKFASVTSTIPLPAMFSFSYVVNVALSADAPSEGAAAFGDLYECIPFGRLTLYRNTAIGCQGRGKSRKMVGRPRTGSEPDSNRRSPLALLFWRCLGWTQRLDVADQLPALRLRQAGPYRHTLAHNAIGQQPEQGTRRRLLHVLSAQARPFFPAIGIRSVTLRAMQFEKLGSCRQCFRVCFERIMSARGFGRYLRQFRIDRLRGTLLSGVVGLRV